ncbi:MAG TPA: sugar ABC transporter substrate-binding protein, partial [Herpetosiphonaceae bacterium]
MHIGYASQSPNSHFWLIVGHGVETRAEELGVKLTLLSGTTLDQQSEAITTLIDQHVDVLLIGPSRATGLATHVARARSAGIPVVVLAAELQDCQVDATVRVDHRHGAELAAAYAVAQIGGRGAVAQIMGPRWLQDNVDRAEGVRHIFSQHPGIELVFEQESPDWLPSSGAALMQAALEQ